MKSIFLLTLIYLFTFSAIQAQDESPYLLINKSDESLAKGITKIKSALSESGFKILGEYNPAQSENLAVVCYTHPKLEEIALNFSDRGALASALKVGLKKEGETLKISMTNPMYLFYAYFVDGVDEQEKALRSISDQAIKAMKNIGTMEVPFGGTLEKKKLQKYHYKVMMPYFTDAEELKTFDSFDEGLKTIQQNLKAGKGETEKVYELVYTDKEVAVWGVALKNAEDGEAHFLPIIGDEHVAAMPYEIILQGNTASILPGKYRIALHWPELTMGTFMKIMSTPGDIKTTMEKLTE
ncbi:hypothetical protein [Draconibacterium sediminis]|uniref:hypothetical protein n=1 Tax=Draconibacterium sediminis TaxID=1544798 RepID=UPI0026E9A0EC|nr:hypothetical protein [Draconibacterium sediminis]